MISRKTVRTEKPGPSPLPVLCPALKYNILVHQVPIHIPNDLRIPGTPLQRMPGNALHLPGMGPPGSGDGLFDPLLHRLRRRMIVSRNRLIQPICGEGCGSRPGDTEIYGIRKVEKSAAISFEAHTIQGVIYEDDAEFQFLFPLLGTAKEPSGVSRRHRTAGLPASPDNGFVNSGKRGAAFCFGRRPWSLTTAGSVVGRGTEHGFNTSRNRKRHPPFPPSFLRCQRHLRSLGLDRFAL